MVFGVTYKNLKIATAAHDVNYYSAQKRVKQLNDTAEEAIVHLLKYKKRKGISCFGKHYASLHALADKYLVRRTSLGRLIANGTSPEQAIRYLQNLPNRCVEYSGVTYRSLAAACLALDLSYKSAQERKKKKNETPEEVLVHMMNYKRSQEVTYNGKRYAKLSLLCAELGIKFDAVRNFKT